MRGKMPDTSRGLSPSGAKAVIESLQAVTRQRDEANRHVMDLQQDVQTLKEAASHIAKKLAAVRRENLELKLELKTQNDWERN